MIRVFCFLFVTFFSWRAFGQDSTRHLFKPGTLVGKYYGTYDTTTRKNIELMNTKKVSNLEQNANAIQPSISNTIIPQKPQLQINQNYDPIEVSGTEKTGQINVSGNSIQTKLSDKTLSGRPALEINRNYDPIEVSGTTQAGQIEVAPTDDLGNIKVESVTSQTPMQKTVQPVPEPAPVRVSNPYRATRLGSSSPLYDTYQKNDNGAGSITTNPDKGTGAAMSINPGAEIIQPSSTNRPDFYRDTRLGSSSPLYNTYRLNDNGAGAVTTSPKNGSVPVSAISVENEIPNNTQPTPKPFYRDTRLGSSSPIYNTYRSNNDGAGSITTNPNKGGGGAVFPSNPIILPEQAPSDSTSASKTGVRSMEKRTDEGTK